MSVFKDGLLDGKVAFITGGGSGIGAGIAKRFVEQGAKVAIFGRRQEKLDEVVGSISGTGGKALGVSGDVRSYDDVEKAINKTTEEFGRLDILINAAAGNFPAPALGMSSNGFKAVVDIDLLGSFNACRAAFEPMSKDGGSMVSITATQAWVPTPLQCHVGAAKAGIAKLTQDLALEWGFAKIRVNAVAPGPIGDTEGMRRLAPQDPKEQEAMQKIMPVGRWGTIDEICDAMLFLVSPSGAFITGTTIVVDGGQALLGSAWFQKMMA